MYIWFPNIWNGNAESGEDPISWFLLLGWSVTKQCAVRTLAALNFRVGISLKLFHSSQLSKDNFIRGKKTHSHFYPAHHDKGKSWVYTYISLNSHVSYWSSSLLHLPHCNCLWSCLIGKEQEQAKNSLFSLLV